VLDHTLHIAISKTNGDVNLTGILQTGEVYDEVENWKASKQRFLPEQQGAKGNVWLHVGLDRGPFSGRYR
jgi:hypothetical protein